MTELAELLRSPYADDELASGTNALVVDNADGRHPALAAGSLPVVIIGIDSAARTADHFDHHDHRDHRDNLDSVFDVMVEPDDPLLDSILTTTDRHPLAATSLAVLLRSSEHLSVEHALAAESAVYSVLQSGPEFASWRAGSPAHARPVPADIEPAVIGERIDDVLTIQLNRPHRHNAFSRSIRDGLSELLAVALLDDSIRSVHLSGRGPSFCSGGDLGEFGLFDDPATAHVTRLSRSPARLLHRLAARTHVHLHGACMGAGIELPAFADRVSAVAGTVIALPELGLGLIPGAGGTVSLPRRIGRQRTAYLALSGTHLTAETARQWGLVDEIV